MSTPSQNNPENPRNGSMPGNTPNDDLTDSRSDEERLKSETSYIDLPEVKDIPGQEHINVAPLGELADTTISSDDEEGIINGDSDDDGYFNANPNPEEEDTAGIP